MRMNTVVLAALALIPFLPFAAKAEDAPKVSDSEKIDSILTMQKQVVRTIQNDPLTGKNFGVEMNIARLLLFKDVQSFSGGFSLFGVDRDAEIAFPFLYSRSEIDASGPEEESLANIDFTEITQDIHYRYFLGNTQNGFYLSGFARGAYLEGVLLDYAFGDAVPGTTESRDSETKLGLGVGLGYRFFSYKGLYWGASLGLGRYVLGESDRFRGSYFGLNADQAIILDVELLKFGWAF